MAATPSKPSPTSQPVQQRSTVVENGAAADPPGKEMSQQSPLAPPTTPNDTQQPPQLPQQQQQEVAAAVFQMQPTYESSEQSDYFLTAKQLLADGDFEQALVTIQEGLETTKAFLETSAAMTGVPSPCQTLELHEALAPLHYLYGTTLLYSVEESTDSQQMTVGGNGSQDTPVDGPGGGAEAGGDGAEAATEGAPSVAEGVQEGKGMEQYADDMQIAWENLDAARTIVEMMLAQEDDGTMPYVRRTRLQLGLAQILLREGDLQRLNGRYTDAVADYEACLNLRQKLMHQQDPFNRQIADVHYNLGLTYLTSSSEFKKQQSTTSDEPSTSSDPQNGGETPMDAATRDKLSEEHRVKGIFHYLECAKVFCGRIAMSCGADPQEIITGIRIDQDGVARAGLKTTGLDDDHQETKSTSKESLELSSMRRRVAGLTPLTAGDSGVADLRQFLDEIQETVDEAAVSQEAVRQASELKVKAQEAVGQLGAVETDSSGVTTQIGFGTATTSTTNDNNVALGTDKKGPAVIGTGDNDGKNISQVTSARPMMVVKKKKRPEAPTSSEDSKPPPAENTKGGDSKRTKTE